MEEEKIDVEYDDICEATNKPCEQKPKCGMFCELPAIPTDLDAP